ncbi:hypothetical protein HK102_012924, partial [Quaeritorhiza haematococci]
LWDLNNGSAIRTYDSPTSQITSACFRPSSSGETLFTMPPSIPPLAPTPVPPPSAPAGNPDTATATGDPMVVDTTEEVASG